MKRTCITRTGFVDSFGSIVAILPQYCQKGLLRQYCQKLICMGNPVLPQCQTMLQQFCCNILPEALYFGKGTDIFMNKYDQLVKLVNLLLYTRYRRLVIIMNIMQFPVICSLKLPSFLFFKIGNNPWPPYLTVLFLYPRPSENLEKN